MARYLSMLKIDTKEFVSNNIYKTLAEMKVNARRREIELEIQQKEKRQAPSLSQPTTKRFKHDQSKSGGQKGPWCKKCGNYNREIVMM